jgi:hypothetical protein
MPRRYLMSDLIARIRKRADIVNDDSIDDDDIKEDMEEVYAELWAEVARSGQRYFETSATVTATGAASYDEEAGHFSTVRVVRVLDDGKEVPLRELQAGEEPHYRGTTGDATAYAHVDDQLFLYPNPSSGTYKWYYRYQPTDLSQYADGQYVDVVSGAGLAFLIWGTAAIELGKGEKDVRFALQQKDAAMSRVILEAAEKSTETRSVYVDNDDDGVIPLPTWERS